VRLADYNLKAIVAALSPGERAAIESKLNGGNLTLQTMRLASGVFRRIRRKLKRRAGAAGSGRRK
jgi:hypothetical protein